VGTYSSIFVASPILIFWRNWAEEKKKAQTPAAAGNPQTKGNPVAAAPASGSNKKLAGGRTK
jgi:hypothetical protein